MSNIFLAILSLVIIMALALTSVFFGGSIFSESSLKSCAAEMVAQAEQIKGAYEVYLVDQEGARPFLVEDMVPKYLDLVPVPPQCAYAEGYTATKNDWVLVNGNLMIPQRIKPEIAVYLTEFFSR